MLEALAPHLGTIPAEGFSITPRLGTPAEPLDVVVLGLRPAAADDQTASARDPDIALLAEWGVDLPRRLDRRKASGRRGELTWIDLESDTPRAVAVLGLGLGGASTHADLRLAGAALARRLRGKTRALVLATTELDEPSIQAFAEGLLLATAPPTWRRTTTPEPLLAIELVVADERAGIAIDSARVHAGATLAARRLIHTPGNLKNPSTICAQATGIAGEVGLDVRIWDEAKLADEGFGGLLAVGAGSQCQPRLASLSWPASAGLPPPAPKPTRHVVLVGKGITFDSGGLSLKRPAETMIGMKTDMSGAAVVLAVLAALPGRLPEGIRVTGLLCLAENMPGGRALRPGDVITHHGGITSEVVNTDAEGRLVLADALDLAAGQLEADVIVDIATLTGAATLGLGRKYAALYSTSDSLAVGLTSAGAAAGELVWRMPLHAQYETLIASEVADVANADTHVGWAPGPGSITAALFLQRFVRRTPWAHLDIAGTGRSDADRDDLPKGGTGFGARLLLRWLESGAPA